MPGALKAKVGGQWVLASSAAGGGGAEEVYVGPSDPGTSYDLWIDTDEPATLADDTRWNTAWGVIGTALATSTFTTSAPHTTAQATGLAVTVTETAGRRLNIRVQHNPYPGGGIQAMQFGLQRNGVAVEGWFIPGEAMGAGSSLAVSRTFSVTATGGSATYSVVVNAPTTNTAVSDYGSAATPRSIVVEDAGPVAGALATIQPESRWNTAWGIVGQGSFVGGAAYSVPAAMTRLNPDLIVTTLRGRRYRTVLQVRVISPTTGSGVNFLPRGPGVGGSSVDLWHQVTSGYSYAHMEMLFIGQGSAGVYYWDANPTSATTLYLDTMSLFYIEDIGPVSGAVAVPDPTPAWITMSLVSTWGPYPNEQVPQYRKIGDIVYLRGTPEVKAGQTGANVFATLPVGFRPPKNAYAITSVGDAGTGTTGVWTVQTDGSVSCDGPKTAGSWLSLDNIQFSVTP